MQLVSGGQEYGLKKTIAHGGRFFVRFGTGFPIGKNAIFFEKTSKRTSKITSRPRSAEAA